MWARGRQARGWGWAAGAFLLVAAGTVAVTLPLSVSRVALMQDTVGYLAAAQSWLAGSGLVDPVLYSHYLGDARPPVPAILIRPPVVSVLLAAGLALGMGLVALGAAHAVWASCIGASTTLLGLRLMSLPSAVGLGLLVGWSNSWLRSSAHLLTEATAVGVLLLLIAAAPLGLRSARGALLLAALTLLGWLTRPNLALFAGLFALAACLDLGPRAALRSRPLWIYLGSFLLLHRAVVVGVELTTGFPPYAHYGIMLESLSFEDLARFQAEYGGVVGFVSDHARQLLAITGSNLGRTAETAFLLPYAHYVGWLALPGVVHGLLRRGEASFTSKLVALAALGFTAVAVCTSWGFDVRYLQPGFVCAWVAAMAFLDQLARTLALRWDATGARTLLRATPLALAVVLVSVEDVPEAVWRARMMASGSVEVREKFPSGPLWSQISSALCEPMHPDALVASPVPWNILYWCGNAGTLLPVDLDDLEWLHRYLDRRAPGYVIAEDPDDIALFQTSRRLVRQASIGHVVLFRVVRAGPASRPWRSPGPLAALGPGRERARPDQDQSM